MTASRGVWFVGLTGWLVACATAQPVKTTVQEKNAACQGTEPGHACLTLDFSASDAVRKNTKRPVAGPLHWAVYKGGDVAMMGPGSNKPVYSGIIPHVDLTADGSTDQVTVPNVVPQSYQVLAYVDEANSGTGTAASGDAVTIPSHPFNVPANEHTRASVVLDYIR